MCHLLGNQSLSINWDSSTGVWCNRFDCQSINIASINARSYLYKEVETGNR